MEFFESFFKTVLSEYGLLVALLLGGVVFLWRRNNFLSDKLIELIENNIRVLTEVAEEHKRKKPRGD